MRGNLKETTDYILRFLLGKPNAGYADFIGYTADEKKFSNYKIVIIPSEFFDENVFGTPRSLPELPLQSWRETPLLFGASKEEQMGETLIIHADIIASTFFLISRYEETVSRDDRDVHGRFPGKKSLPFRAGFLHRPIVDEYGKSLRELLKKAGLDSTEPDESFQKIYLTHDADLIAHYRNLRGVGGALSRVFKNPYQALKALQTCFFSLKHDPWYTFPWLFELAKELKNVKPKSEIEVIVFIKSGGGEMMPDKPLHNIFDKDFGKLFNLCRRNSVKIGLHPSYLAGEKTELIVKEKSILDKAFKQNTVYSRNHFLRNREPEDFQALLDAGLTDDFTMTYADVAGFRLGTCKAVNWINPKSLEVTKLILHSTVIMDSTLSDVRYMNLSADSAFSFSKKMIDEVKKHNGELVLLWHNTAVEKNNGLYHRDLYSWIINYLKQPF